MDIRTEQLQALLKQQEFQTKKSSSTQNESGEGFAAVLEQASLGGTENDVKATPTPPGAQASLVGQMLLVDAENISVEQTMTNDAAYDSAAIAMDKWESYVNTLRTPREGNLRDAYNALEDVASHVQTLKQQSEPLLKQNDNLAGIVNELDILTTTEKFKFNRGDYLT